MYKGYNIFPDLGAEGGKYRLSARIEKTIDGYHKTYVLIREEAESSSIAKAKQVVDSRGELSFDCASCRLGVHSAVSLA